MDEMYKIISNRHSVRTYLDQPLDAATIQELQKTIAECNLAGKLNIQLFINEPKAFDTIMAHYGKFKNVKNYITLIGKKAYDLEERCGYYGEKIVLKAQSLGLNTCFVGATYGKKKIPYDLASDEKIVITIAIGYGKNAGISHHSKTFEIVSKNTDDVPDWYKRGVEWALLAPTAMNQQKFRFALTGPNTVEITTKSGFFVNVDLGIAKLHFELGAGINNFKWD